ncbi:MAG: ABC transporter substrate-binding protein [Methylovirgula sp.]
MFLPRMKRSVWVIATIVATVVMCNVQAADPSHSEQKTVLHVIGWDVYADPDHRDKTIGFKTFEKLTGTRIAFTPLNTLDEILNAAEASNETDVIIISNEGVKILYGMNLVVPLNLKNIPNYQDLHPRLRYSEWTQFGSKVYAVPWAWGPTGLLYDASAMAAPDSWNVMWDPKYRGKVALWDDVSVIWTTALSLGYKNVYNLTKAQLSEVKKKLFALNTQLSAYYGGEQDEMKLILAGKAQITNSWFDPSARLRQFKRNYAMVIPKEGAVGMFDSYLIRRGSTHADLDYQFINHQISPETQLQLVRITGLNPANIETLSLLTAGEIAALHLGEADYFDRMLLWDTMPRKPLYDELLGAVRQDFKVKQAGHLAP